MARHYKEDEIPEVYNFVEDIPGREVREGVHQKVFRGLNGLVGFTTLEPGMEPGPHSHPWEQIAFIYSGTCDFHVGDEVVSVEEGDIFVIPPGETHYAVPNSDEPCVNLDFWPLREDYLDRTEYQSEFIRYEYEE